MGSGGLREHLGLRDGRRVQVALVRQCLLQQRPLLHGESLVGREVDVGPAPGGGHAPSAYTPGPVLVAVELAPHVHVTLVASEVVGLREAPMTDLALVGPLSSMNTLVHLATEIDVSVKHWPHSSSCSKLSKVFRWC